MDAAVLGPISLPSPNYYGLRLETQNFRRLREEYTLAEYRWC